MQNSCSEIGGSFESSNVRIPAELCCPHFWPVRTLAVENCPLKTVACGHRIIDQVLGSFSSKTVACSSSKSTTGVGNGENPLIIQNRIILWSLLTHED